MGQDGGSGHGEKRSDSTTILKVERPELLTEVGV